MFNTRGLATDYAVNQNGGQAALDSLNRTRMRREFIDDYAHYVSIAYFLLVFLHPGSETALHCKIFIGKVAY